MGKKSKRAYEFRQYLLLSFAYVESNLLFINASCSFPRIQSAKRGGNKIYVSSVRMRGRRRRRGGGLCSNFSSFDREAQKILTLLRRRQPVGEGGEGRRGRKKQKQTLFSSFKVAEEGGPASFLEYDCLLSSPPLFWACCLSATKGRREG